MRTVTTGLTPRERMGEGLGGFPLLRTLLFNPWFALVLGVTILLGTAVAVSLPKVWRSTPNGFRPEVKASLLDFMQARALRASAERKAGRGDYAGAAIAWQTAIANDRGNVELYRGAFQHLGGPAQVPLAAASRILGNAGWLTRLGGTNRADVELLAAVFDKYDMGQEVYDLLHASAKELAPGLEEAYLKALFAVGRYEEFGARWKTIQDQHAASRTLELYATAYRAGWARLTERREAFAQLKSTMEDAEYGSLARRLMMRVSVQHEDPDTFNLALTREREASCDRIVDHAAYWRLLYAVGRQSEARRAAREFNRPPTLASEVVTMAEALRELGLKDECLHYLEQHAAAFGGGNNRWSAALWGAYADLLTERDDWEGLKEMASLMRSIPGGHPVLAGYGRFVEGQAAWMLGVRPTAQAAFQEAVAYGFPLGRLSLYVARNLMQMGYHNLALEALRSCEGDYHEDLEYWQLVFDAAYFVKEDEVLLLKAARRAHELAPESLQWQCNYAVARLIGQWRPEEAIPVTLSYLNTHPDQVAAQLNHAVALVLNGRCEEAAELLARILPGELTGEEADAYHFAAAGASRGLGNWLELREHLDALASARLFPAQRRWLDQIGRSLPLTADARLSAGGRERN